MTTPLQPYCSRPLSIKARLAAESWKKGTDIFFTQNIPFSGRNGPAFARQLADLFATIATPINTKPYHLYEFGAGLGLLAKQVLDSLQKNHPTIYEHTILHLTDGSEETITQLSQAKYFDKHRAHIRFKTMSLADLKISSDEPALFCYSIYLLDALDTRHIRYENGVFSEILVQTHLKTDSIVQDTTQFPPIPLNESDIIELCQALDSDKARHLATQLAQVIEETTQATPIEKLNHWTSEEKEDLNGFINAQEPTQTAVQFNYIPQLKAHLNSVQKGLHPDGMYLISDFGLATDLLATETSELTATYGSTMFYSICFPYLSYLTQQTEGFSWNTSRELDQTQEWILFKNLKYLQHLTHHIPAKSDPCIEPISLALDTISALSPEDPNYAKTLNKAINSLTKEGQSDYFFLKRLVLQLFQDGYFKEAFEWAEKMADYYEVFAIPGLLVAGWIYQKQGDEDLALPCFKTVIKQCPTMAMGYASLAALYFSQKNYSQAAEQFVLALKFSGPQEIPFILTSLEKALGKLALTENV